VVRRAVGANWADPTQGDGEQIFEQIAARLPAGGREVLAALRDGERKSEIAERTGVSRARITHHMDDIRDAAKYVAATFPTF